jgi:hypothetical protein
VSLIRTGCGIEGLRGLAPGSVDLVFSDLPSGETRAHFDNPIDLAAFWPAAWACLKPSGAVVLMASSLRFAAEVIASEPKAYRYDVVWEKGRATGHLNAAKAPMRAHEFILVFYRKHGTYNPQKTTGHELVRCSPSEAQSANYGRVRGTEYESAERYPRSVVEFTAMANSGSAARRHPQQKPIPLLQWVVRTYTNQGELIAEPCAGSGSMGVAAIGEGREYVGWDFEPKPPQAVQVGLMGVLS